MPSFTKIAFGLVAAVLLTGIWEAYDSIEFYREFDIEGRQFLIPDSHVKRSLSAEETWDRKAFVRLGAASWGFDIEHLGRNYRYELTKNGNPYVAHVTSPTMSDEEHRRVDGIDVVCKPNWEGLHYGCGIRLEHSGLIWGILFDHDRIDEAGDIRSRAISLLDSYRTNSAEQNNLD